MEIRMHRSVLELTTLKTLSKLSCWGELFSISGLAAEHLTNFTWGWWSHRVSHCDLMSSGASTHQSTMCRTLTAALGDAREPTTLCNFGLTVAHGIKVIVCLAASLSMDTDVKCTVVRELGLGVSSNVGLRKRGSGMWDVQGCYFKAMCTGSSESPATSDRFQDCELHSSASGQPPT